MYILAQVQVLNLVAKGWSMHGLFCNCWSEQVGGCCSLRGGFIEAERGQLHRGRWRSREEEELE